MGDMHGEFFAATVGAMLQAQCVSMWTRGGTLQSLMVPADAAVDVSYLLRKLHCAWPREWKMHICFFSHWLVLCVREFYIFPYSAGLFEWFQVPSADVCVYVVLLPFLCLNVHFLLPHDLFLSRESCCNAIFDTLPFPCSLYADSEATEIMCMQDNLVHPRAVRCLATATIPLVLCSFPRPGEQWECEGSLSHSALSCDSLLTLGSALRTCGSCCCQHFLILDTVQGHVVHLCTDGL